MKLGKFFVWIITNALLGLNSDTPIKDKNGQPIFVEKEGVKRAYTIGNAADAYVIVIQAGAIAAVSSSSPMALLFFIQFHVASSLRGSHIRPMILAKAAAF